MYTLFVVVKRKAVHMSKTKQKSPAKKDQKPCHKKGFKDEISARLALAKIKNKDDSKRHKQETRVYYCKQCKRYHLTSK